MMPATTAMTGIVVDTIPNPMYNRQEHAYCGES